MPHHNRLASLFRQIDFLIEKAKFYDRVKEQLNPRQEKVIARKFEEGLAGFRGGLSANNDLSITATSRAAATLDLQALAAFGVLLKTGELKATRYHLNLHAKAAEQNTAAAIS